VICTGGTRGRASYVPRQDATVVTEWPSAVVRGGTSPQSLPIGVQVVARPWREDVALYVANILRML